MGNEGFEAIRPDLLDREFPRTVREVPLREIPPLGILQAQTVGSAEVKEGRSIIRVVVSLVAGKNLLMVQVENLENDRTGNFGIKIEELIRAAYLEFKGRMG
jgi:hypothetical protein